MIKDKCFTTESNRNIEKLTLKKKIPIIANTLKSLIGLGILVIPKVLYQVGTLYGILILILCYIIFIYGIILLFEVLEKINFEGNRYDSLVEQVLGKKYKIFMNIIIIYTQFCFCVATNIIASNFLNFIICLFNFKNYCNQLQYIYLYGFLMSIPIMFIKRLNSFAFISFFSVFIILFSIFIIIFNNIFVLINNTSLIKMADNNLFKLQIINIPQLIGISLYAFEGIGIIIPIRFTIKPFFKEFEQLYLSITNFCLILIIILSLTSIYTFGDHLNDFLFYNFNKDQIFIVFLGILYAISVFISFPINLFPIYDIINSFDYFKERINRYEFFYGMRFILLIFIYMIVILIPNFMNFMSFVGSLITFILGVLIPVLLYNKVFENNHKIINYNYIYLTVSLSLCIISEIDSIKNLIWNNN